ncbi:MAG: DUF3011 domain-containing protein [Xanthomonadaceae bacterium]|jgi:hypothetical protein|nr:DUF3011 domain-containing protein [Xanthomonadaceae bacterium]
MPRILIVAVLLAILLPAPADAQRQQKQTTYALIRCESPGGRESFCPADTRRGVRLVQTLQGRCQLGRSWGYEAGGIWVRGCSAEFEIGNRGDDGGWGWGHNDGRVVVCASENFRYQVCEVNTRGGVALVSQFSRAECVEGRSWGYDRRGIWVDQGCAAQFEVGGGAGGRPPFDRPPTGGDWNSGATGSTFVCESRDGRRRYCEVDLGGRSVSVVRNISRVPCSEGDTWGIDRRGLWVDGGCRAEFRIIEDWGNGRPGGGRPGGGYPDGGYAAGTVRCESKEFKRAYCDTAGANRVELQRQISRTPCVEGDTWGWDRRGLWVDRGCAAEFATFR